MALETFTWCPQTQSPGTVTHKTRSAKFADGYEQVSGDGINSKSQSWDLSFTDSEKTIRQIKAFLDLHKGFRSFAWSPPLGVTGLYRAGEYRVIPLGAKKFTLAVTFAEAFHP